jgi:hypothetical protein
METESIGTILAREEWNCSVMLHHQYKFHKESLCARLTLHLQLTICSKDLEAAIDSTTSISKITLGQKL